MINDAHCHFFSPRLFATLATQRGSGQAATDICTELGWTSPADVDSLADAWVASLDAHSVARCALIASMPGDEDSVAAAVRRHPKRFVGFFMLDPAASDAVERTTRALTELGLRTVCLFPAMHHVPLTDERIDAVVDAVSKVPGAAVFVHCGVLSVGVRKKLGLPSRFDLRLGNPLELSRIALAYPTVPFIIPHFGAGLFREALMAADVCSNIHLDTSSSNGWLKYTPALTLGDAFRMAVRVVGPSRLLFGTDSSYFPRGWNTMIYDEQKAVVVKLGLGAADAGLVFGGNFERLFPVREVPAAGGS